MPYNILIVDDSKDFRDALKEYLDGYGFKEASSAKEALNILKKPNEIDLVLLDVMLPGQKGTEILRSIKQISPKLGVVIVTGYSNEDTAIEALKGHADEYVDKHRNLDKIPSIVDNFFSSRERKVYSDKKGIKGQVERAKDFIQRNYDKKISLEDVAQKVCLSAKYFSRVFKEQTDLSFSRYKMQVKVEKAKELLENTEYRVGQIANKLGYENLESFIQIFKKITKLSPLEYKESNKKIKAGKKKKLKGAKIGNKTNRKKIKTKGKAKKSKASKKRTR